MTGEQDTVTVQWRWQDSDLTYQVTYFEVDAETFGYLAVHPQIVCATCGRSCTGMGDCRPTPDTTGMRWTVTHIPTGLSINTMPFGHRGTAVRFAEEASADPFWVNFHEHFNDMAWLKTDEGRDASSRVLELVDYLLVVDGYEPGQFTTPAGAGGARS